jgi:RNA recognition motif-containing protein
MKKRIPNLNLFSQPLSSFWTLSLLEEVTGEDVLEEVKKNRKLYSPSVRVENNKNKNTPVVNFVSDLNSEEEKKSVEDSKNLYHQNLSRPKRVKVNKGQIKSTNKNELPPLQKYSGTKEEKKKKKESFAYLKVENIPISIPVKDVETLFSSYGEIEKSMDHVEENNIYSLYFKLKYESDANKMIKELNHYLLGGNKMKVQLYQEKMDENLIFKKYLTPFEFPVQLMGQYQDENGGRGVILTSKMVQLFFILVYYKVVRDNIGLVWNGMK